MKPSASSSVSGTAATPPNAPPANPAANPAIPDAALSESEFLKRKADQAAAAMRATLGDFTSQFKTAADVRNWTRQYPWAATSVAAAAGFTAAFVLAPRDRQDARRKWESLKSTFTPEAEEDRPRPTKRETGWLALLIAEGLKFLRPMLVGLITNMAAKKAPETNGHDTAEPAPAGPAQ